MDKKRIVIILIIIVGIFGMYILGKHLVKPKYGKKDINPYDLKIDSIGQIADDNFCNYSSSKIKLNLKNAKAVGIGYDDLIYVSGDNKIQIFNSEGTFISDFETAGTATSITISESNELYLGLKDHIEKYDSTHNLISKWESISENAYITSIALKNNEVFLAEAETKLVYVYNNSGVLEDIFGDSVATNDIICFVVPSYYFDLKIDTEGFLWVANTGKHKLISFNSSGDFRSYWGESSSAIEGFCGCCNPTHFSIMEDGSFITSEKGIVRVKKYNSAGKFVCAIAGPEHFKKNSEGLDIAIDSKQNIYVLEPMAQVIHIFKEN